MISFDGSYTILSSLIATLGLSWIFYPAWLAAGAHCLEWKERYLSKERAPVAVLLSLVVPAYNEEERIEVMLQDAHDYLKSQKGKVLIEKLQECAKLAGYTQAKDLEFLIVNDGSEDGTEKVVQSTFVATKSRHSWKIVSLKVNSGKGAAVQTGMLLAKGIFRLMVDADGATDFGPGLEQLVNHCLAWMELPNDNNKMICIFGSRALLERESVTERSFVRTIMMYGFHFFVSLLVSSHIRDTQCGFKLFTKDSALATFGSLHLRRWAFDTEVCLLCDYKTIKMLEVPVPWHEVDGSKLNTSKLALALAAISMLRDMVCVRACYSCKIWKVSK